MTSQYLRLKDNHPTMEKLMKLYDLAEELGISISFYSHRIVVEDADRNKDLPPLYLEDIENSHNSISEFPPATEFKIIYENPKYLEERQQEHQSYLIKKNEESRLAEENRLQKEAQEKEIKARELEKEERSLLKRLKNKYES